MSKNLMKAVGMSVVIWNPTNEDLEMQYAGRSFTLFKGEKEEVNEACANHLLNAFGQRGLTFLKYGDDEEAVGADGRKRNYDFKKRQVTQYNQTNEQRKMAGLGYHFPTQKLKDYALELGINLLEPYALKDEEKSAISKSTKEAEDLRKKLAEQADQMAEMQKMLAQLIGNKEQKVEKKPKKVRCTVCNKWMEESELEQHKQELHKGG